MPFKTEIPVTTQDLVTYLQENFGNEVAVPQLMKAADEFRCSLGLRQVISDSKNDARIARNAST